MNQITRYDDTVWYNAGWRYPSYCWISTVSSWKLYQTDHCTNRAVLFWYQASSGISKRHCAVPWTYILNTAAGTSAVLPLCTSASSPVKWGERPLPHSEGAMRLIWCLLRALKPQRRAIYCSYFPLITLFPQGLFISQLWVSIYLFLIVFWVSIHSNFH